MTIVDTLMPLAIGMVGIVLGSVINYFVLKKLIKGQVGQVLDIFEGTVTGKEIADMIHRLNKFSKSEDAKRLIGKLEKALNDLIGEENN